MIESMAIARFHLNTRNIALKKQAHQAHVSHTVMKSEIYDPSLTNRLVYGNRADWYAAAASLGFCDIELAADTGLKRFPQASELTPNQKKKGMNLYE